MPTLGQKFCLTTLGQAVVYRELRKFTREYRDILSVSIPPETDAEKSSMGVGTLGQVYSIAHGWSGIIDSKSCIAYYKL